MSPIEWGTCISVFDELRHTTPLNEHPCARPRPNTRRLTRLGAVWTNRNLVAFLSCRRFSDFGYRWRLKMRERIRVVENILLYEESLRSGMVHETHCNFRGPWRRSGGGSFGFFCHSQEAWSRET